jgi:chorismate mutase
VPDKDFSNLIDRLGQASKDCRELLREMHSAQKALHQDIKEARSVIKELDEAAVNAIDHNLIELMNERLEVMGAAFVGAMQDRAQKYSDGLSREATDIRHSIESEVRRVHVTLQSVIKASDAVEKDIEAKATKVAVALEQVTTLTEQAIALKEAENEAG